jgi:hypothetical protein
VIGQNSARDAIKIKPIPDSVLARLIGCARRQILARAPDSFSEDVSEI